MKRPVFACLAFVMCAVLLGATEPKHTEMKLPNGLTPSILKMMMTPLKGHPAAMPAGTVAYDGCIPAMGYHYADPKNWPLGPVYGYYNGKAVFTEAMIDQRDFDRGRNFDELLKPLPGYHIDHVDIWFERFGHPGYTIPHYDIHAWYIPRSQYMYFCGNKSGKKPAFL